MLIFFKLETTGLEENDKIVSLALMAQDGDKLIEIYELVDEGKKIPSSASSINHITNEMIKGKESVYESDSYDFLFKYNFEDSILVGHNIRFYLKKLDSLGFEWKGKIIDTMRVSKHIMPELDSFALQFLRYELKLYKDEKKRLFPHYNLDDVILVQNLFNYLLSCIDIEKMVELTDKKILLQKFEFGKYKGHNIEDIALNDRAYLEWLLYNVNDLEDDLKYSIKYYLGDRF